MSPKNNITPTLMLLFCYITLSLAPLPITPNNIQAAPIPPSTPAPVDLGPAQSEVAHSLIDQWLQQGFPKAGQKIKPLPIKKLLGVNITLSWQQWKIGSGIWLNPQAPKQGDLATGLAKALKRAIKKSEQLRGISVKKHFLAGHIQVHIQIATGDTIIFRAKNAPVQDLFRRFVPMYHGLKLTRGNGNNKITSWIWPADMRHKNIQPRAQLRLLLQGVGLTWKDTDALGIRATQTQLHRFNVQESIRTAKAKHTQILTRGGKIKDAQKINQTHINQFTQKLAKQIIKWQRKKDGGILGRYDAAAGKFVSAFQSQLASDYDQALAFYALQLQKKQQKKNPKHHKAIEKATQRLYGFMISKIKTYRKGQGLPIKAMFALALFEEKQNPDWITKGHQLIAQLIANQAPDGRFFEAKTQNTKQNPNPKNKPQKPNADKKTTPLKFREQGIALAALTKSYAIKQTNTKYKAIKRSRKILWANLKRPFFEYGLVWMMLAEQTMLDVENVNPQNAQGIAARQIICQKLLGHLRDRQCTQNPQIGPPDTQGGFNPKTQSIGGADYPDWTTSFDLMFMALCLQDTRIIDKKDRLQSILDARNATRFLSQLTFDPISSYYVKNRSMAIGAVRAALWDHRLKLRYTTMTLIAISQYQIALQRLNDW